MIVARAAMGGVTMIIKMVIMIMVMSMRVIVVMPLMRIGVTGSMMMAVHSGSQ